MAASWDFGDGSSSGTGSSGVGGSSQSGSSGTSGGTWGDEPARHRAAARSSANDWGTDTASPGGGETVSAPLLWLAIALVLSAAGLVVGLVTDSARLATMAWAVGGPLAIGMIAVFVHRDTLRRAQPWYAASELADWGRRVVIVLSLAAVSVNAWTIADQVARGSF